jgi:L-threonylcarbamoyladenylate synthase
LQSASVRDALITDQPSDAAEVARAARLLHDGGLVAFPTETVYGLGADAGNAEAVARLYKVKKRPDTHPVIVHLSDVEQLHDWAAEVPEGALRLAERFWPGPLTLVLKRAVGVPDAVTGGQATVGLRIPSHPMALALLRQFREAGSENEAAAASTFNQYGSPPVASAPRLRGGIAAPSANRYGRISPTRAEHVRSDLGDDVDCILNGGACEVGIESTIVDYSSGHPVLLRPGGLSAARIAEVAGEELLLPGDNAPRAPGSHAAHYAPRARLKLLRRTDIIEYLAQHKGQRVAALALEVSVARLAAQYTVVMPAVAAGYARMLYANLRHLDASGADMILVELPPDTPAWAPVLDRLRRAAHDEPLAPREPGRWGQFKRKAAAGMDVEAEGVDGGNAVMQAAEGDGAESL